MGKAQILVVEDDRIVAKDIQNSLKNLGFDVCASVPSGEEALEKAEEQRPDLVLMDIMLKREMNGTEAAEQIRSRFNIPVVYLTAYADEEVLERAKKTEPFGYIIKPFEERELNTAIQIALYKHKMEMKLRESEEWLSTTLKSIGDAVIATDKEGHVTFMNPVAEGLTGWQQEEAKGKPLKDVFHIINEETREEVENPFSKVIRDGKVVGLANHTVLISREGTEIPIDDSGAPIRDEKGVISGVVLVFRDISDRKKADEAVARAAREWQTTFDSSNDAIWVLDESHRILRGNKTAEKLVRKSCEEQTGKHCWEVVHGTTQAIPGCPVQRVQETRKRETMELPIGDRHFEVIVDPILDASGLITGFVHVVSDITDRKRAEEERIKLEDQLHRAQKMEALGLMAGGIAHDLNNILSGIVSYPELLLMDLPEDSPLRNPIKTIQESGMRAADVVEDLLTMARGVAMGKETLNLNTMVTEYLGSPEYQKLEKTRSFVNCRTELDPDLLNMSGSSTHIKKILMNLVTNASEAIEGSGMVIISTTNRYLDEPLKGYEHVRTGEYTVLSVSDDGSGISAQDLERIFEPFYTKKSMGRSGTGLGLAVVWNSVQDHNGYINVKSSDKGTVFELYFPVTREEIAAEGEVVPLEDYLGHGEKILVVDDEERQLEIACGMLTKLGYYPEAVSSGEEAVEYVKTNPVDLLVLDMIMDPGIDGLETYRRIIEFRPGQKAIIASGFSETKRVKEAQRLGAGAYVKKPFLSHKIGPAIRAELDK